MTEGFFILTSIFVAYVVYAVIADQKATAKAKTPTAKPEAQATAVEQAKPNVAVAKEKSVTIKPAMTKAATPKAATTKTATPKVTAKPTKSKAATAKKATADSAQNS